MLVTIQPSSLSGTVLVPPSKSHSVRALLMTAMAEGTSELKNILDSEDVKAALGVIKDLGAQAEVAPMARGYDHLQVTVKGTCVAKTSLDKTFYTGQSGITTSFLLPLLGVLGCKGATVDCDEQMKKRPLVELFTALRSLGLHLSFLESPEHCPVRLEGKIEGGNVAIHAKNSQVLSALLLALALAPQKSRIEALSLQERPYVTMTEEWLKRGGISFERTGDTWELPGGQTYQAWSGSIPGDFSSAAPLLAAAALCGEEVRLEGLDREEVQGDKALLEIMERMGIPVEWEENTVVVKGGKVLTGLHIDCADFPDLVPVLAVLGTQAEGGVVLSNVAILRAKESDRLTALCEGLSLMGAQLEQTEESLVVRYSPLKGASLPCFGDHRMAMAFAVAALCAEGASMLEGAECVGKTFPSFFKNLELLGACISYS